MHLSFKNYELISITRSFIQGEEKYNYTEIMKLKHDNNNCVMITYTANLIFGFIAISFRF
jgi:hypothetical protein